MLTRLALILAIGISGMACGSSSDTASATAATSGDDLATDDAASAQDIVDTAVGAGSFTTLAAALEAAGLVETLRGDGPFTVFAPTDAAFAALPAGTVESLLRPENREQLVAVLTYHVVSGDVRASDVVNLSQATTVQGGVLNIDVVEGVRINDANVVQADIVCANGVIHVIDRVLLPE